MIDKVAINQVFNEVLRLYAPGNTSSFLGLALLLRKTVRKYRFHAFCNFFPQVKFSTYIMAKKFKFAENRIKDRKVDFKNKKFKKLHYNM